MLRFARLSGGEQSRLIEAILMLALCRVALRLVPFRRLAPLRGAQVLADAGAQAAIDPIGIGHAAPRVLAVHKGLARARRNVPWHCSCLVQAMAGRLMLRRRGFETELYLGWMRAADDELQFHAWLVHDRYVVTGGDARGGFQPISVFR